MKNIVFFLFALRLTSLSEEIGGVNFPEGAASFADQVIDYDPSFSGGAVPTAAINPELATGAANHRPGNSSFVSLGSGGRLTLEFTDNLLTGSDSDAPDLHIFEIGPDVEDTFVEISMNGVRWLPIGKVFGATSSIDIDSFGFSSRDFFRFVRLTDDPREGDTSGAVVGADIDAVGAISSAPSPIPQVISVWINNGRAQRSMIQSIGVVFDRDVSGVLEATDLKVVNIDTGVEFDMAAATVVFDPTNFAVSWALDRNVNALLPDGNYMAWIEVDQLLSGNPLAECGVNEIPIDDYTFSFHQLAGDADGDRDVDFLDSCKIRDSWMLNQNAEGYKSYFDFDLNDVVAEPDRTVVEGTYFTLLAEQPALHPYLRLDTGDSQSDNATSQYAVAVDLVAIPADATLQVSLNGGANTDVSSFRAGVGKVILSEELLDQINGSDFTPGAYQLSFEARSAEAIVIANSSLDFDYLGLVNCLPRFVSVPPAGIVLGEVQSTEPLNLPGWSVVRWPGAQPDSEWNIASNGLSITQAVNAAPSALLSPDEFISLRVTGQFRVNTEGDDDYMGFIFGYQNSKQFYLFDWKQEAQVGKGGINDEITSLRGMSIKRINAGTRALTESDFWQSNGNRPNMTLLSPPNDIGWADFQDYEITLELSPGEIVVEVRQAGVLLDRIEVEDPSFTGGRFGFYNYSQDSVVYQGFSRETLGNTYNYLAEAVDPEGTPITYTLVDNPDGSSPPDRAAIDPQSGALSWQTETEGRFQLTVAATDADGGTSTQTFFVDVFPADQPPLVQMISTGTETTIGGTAVVEVSATDDVGIATLELFLDGESVPLDRAGRFAISSDDEAVYRFQALATDTGGLTDEEFLSIRFIDPTKPEVPGSPPTGPGGPIGNGEGPAPLVRILSPTGATDDLNDFIGIVAGNGGTLDRWSLDYSLVSVANLDDLGDASVSWAPIANDTTPRNRQLLGAIDYTGFANDIYVFRLVAYNTNGRGSATSVIFNPLDQSIPNVAITSPAPESDLTYLTEIRGTVDPNGGTINNWRLELASASQVSLDLLGDPNVPWQEIASGTDPKNNEVLGTLDTTVLRNDSYVVRLIAFNTNGRGYQIGALYHICGEAKLGNFRIEFTDLSIPLQGIPIQINRIYDTLDTGRFNDFGYGWSLGISDGDIRETVPDTGAGIFSATPIRVGTRVYITTPEGKRVGFTFEPEVFSQGFFGATYKAVFTPDPGVYETLEYDGPAGEFTIAGNGDAVLFLFGFAWNPDDYVLTTQDGTRYRYNQRSGLKTITDTNDNIVSLTTNGFRHSSGASIDFVRDSSGRITEITTPNTGSIKYIYNGSGDLTGVTNQIDATTTFSYYADPAHYLDTIANPADVAQGRYTQKVVYGDDGRVAHVEDGDGNIVAQQSFDPGAFTGTRTDARGNVTLLTYDDRGNLLREEKPEGGITLYEYNDPTNPDKETAITDPNGNRREFTYDSTGNVASETDPLGNVTEYQYDSRSKITSLIRRDDEGNILTSEAATYDAEGNLTRLTNCAGDTRDFVYDVQGRLKMSNDFEGNVTEYDYTNACPCGSPSSILYADGSTKSFEYNPYGQVTKVTDETGAITRFEYDDLGRQVREIDHDGNATVFAYDSNNNLVQRTDRLGRISKFAYDSKNRLEREIKLLTNDGDDSNDVIINYEYDPDDRLAALIDPVGNRTEFVYDTDGRLAIRRDALGKETHIAYHPNGETSEIIDRRGWKRSFQYDTRNLVTAELWHDPADDDNIVRTIATEYDDLGRRIRISDPDSTYAYTYDICSRVRTVDNAGTPNMPNVVLTYAYDKDGRLTSTADSDGVSVITTYDTRGWSDTFGWQGGGIAPASVDIDRNGRGQMTHIKRHSNASLSSLVSQTTYGDIAHQGWVKQISHRDATGALYNSGTNFTYSYDAEGQVIAQSSQGNSTTYSYDLTSQLTGADHTAAAYPDEFYNFDKSGNRISSHLHANYTTTGGNRLQSDGVYNYGYDAEGNLVTKTEISTNTTETFAYDHRGRVTLILLRDFSSVITKSFSFILDTQDRLIGRSEDGQFFFTLYQKENAWADFESTGSIKDRYLFADQIDANLAKWTNDSATEWYLADQIGSIRGLVNEDGAIEGSSAFDSFGRSVIGSQSFSNQRFGFTAREFIQDNLWNYRSRLYPANIGRFGSEDRLGFGGGDPTVYRYVMNSPLNFMDPTGEIIISARVILNVSLGFALITSADYARDRLCEQRPDLPICIFDLPIEVPSFRLSGVFFARIIEDRFREINDALNRL